MLQPFGQMLNTVNLDKKKKGDKRSPATRKRPGAKDEWDIMRSFLAVSAMMLRFSCKRLEKYN